MKIKSAHILPTNGEQVLFVKNDGKLTLPGGCLKHVRKDSDKKVSKELVDKVASQILWEKMFGDKQELKAAVADAHQMKVGKTKDLLFFVKDTEIQASNDEVKQAYKEAKSSASKEEQKHSASKLVLVATEDLKKGVSDKNTKYHGAKLAPETREAICQAFKKTLL